MSYQSVAFILFSLVVLLLYYIVGTKRQLWVLAAANFAFFAIAGIEYIPFILVTILASFYTGRKIGGIYDAFDKKIQQSKESAEKKELRKQAKAEAKKYLLLALGITIGLLGVCKYTGFVLRNLNAVLGMFQLPQLEMFDMVLPIGISFYTFMSVSYVLDVYWKRYTAEQNLLMYAVYVSYFPHVVQGPIDRFNEFKVQTAEGVLFRFENLTYGSQLAIWGFFKKLVIADRLAILVDTILGSWNTYDGIHLIIAFGVYSIQIYADFSGCIDIVTGISEMFGIRLRKNFNHPYFSKTMAEFWRRWHISLQEWFKDYVYYPVSTSQWLKKLRKKAKQKGFARAEELVSSCFPILVVWGITGIWHGAAWKFVVWGMFHASLLIGSQIFSPIFAKLTLLLKIKTDTFSWGLWQMTRTYILCCIGRIFFRAESMGDALRIVWSILVNTRPSAVFMEVFSWGLDKANIIVAVVSVLILLVVDMFQEKYSIREELAKQNLIFRWLVIYAAIFAIVIFGIYGPGYDASSFIYEQF